MPIGTWELVIIFLAVLLLFGGKKIPEIARGLGKGMREFKRAASDIQRELDLSRLDDNVTKRPQSEYPSESKESTTEETPPDATEADTAAAPTTDVSHDPGPEVDVEEEKKKAQAKYTPPSADFDQSDGNQSDVSGDY
jgi:sec-independent protein translocase protein TatA